jgi:hypothetical protein
MPKDHVSSTVHCLVTFLETSVGPAVEWIIFTLSKNMRNANIVSLRVGVLTRLGNLVLRSL